MAEKTGTSQYHFGERWVIILGAFIVLQSLLIVLDSMSFSPNINDGGSLMARTGRGILESRMFTEWITPYSYSFYNMLLTIHVAVLFIQAVTDMSFRVFPKKR